MSPVSERLGWLLNVKVPNAQWNLSGPEERRHLLTDFSEDGEAWCGPVLVDSWRVGNSANPADVSCRACLEAARRFGEDAAARLLALEFRGERAPRDVNGTCTACGVGLVCYEWCRSP